MRPIIPLIAKALTSPELIRPNRGFGGAIYACQKGESLHGGGMLHSPSLRLKRWWEYGADPHAVYRTIIQAGSLHLLHGQQTCMVSKRQQAYVSS
jgi:hypothetical protein